MIINILTLSISIAVLILLVFMYVQKGKVWIQDDINNVSPQRVNRKKLKMEIKKLKHQDIYNSFIIYDDLDLKFPVSINMQDVINQNRKTDKAIMIEWNDYTRSFHIKYKEHYRKVINKSK